MMVSGSFLVMDCLEGETIWEIMKKGRGSLSNKDADDISAAYIVLHNIKPGIYQAYTLRRLGSIWVYLSIRQRWWEVS